jgi:hypothetical protein
MWHVCSSPVVFFFFKNHKLTQNEVRDGEVIKNEGGLHFGVCWSESGYWRSYRGHKLRGSVRLTHNLLVVFFNAKIICLQKFSGLSSRPTVGAQPNPMLHAVGHY